MKVQLREAENLLCVLMSYLVLAVTDTVHHLHATLALGHESALHAVIIGVILTLTALAMVWFFKKYGRKVCLVAFLTIVTVAVVIPGIFHGGWHHAVKLIVAFRSSDNENSIKQLLPGDNLHLWFYELSGVFEFVMALVCVYFIVVYFRDKPEQRSH